MFIEWHFLVAFCIASKTGSLVCSMNINFLICFSHTPTHTKTHYLFLSLSLSHCVEVLFLFFGSLPFCFVSETFWRVFSKKRGNLDVRFRYFTSLLRESAKREKNMKTLLKANSQAAACVCVCMCMCVCGVTALSENRLTPTPSFTQSPHLGVF